MVTTTGQRGVIAVPIAPSGGGAGGGRLCVGVGGASETPVPLFGFAVTLKLSEG